MDLSKHTTHFTHGNFSFVAYISPVLDSLGLHGSLYMGWHDSQDTDYILRQIDFLKRVGAKRPWEILEHIDIIRGDLFFELLRYYLKSSMIKNTDELYSRAYLFLSREAVSIPDLVFPYGSKVPDITRRGDMIFWAGIYIDIKWAAAGFARDCKQKIIYAMPPGVCMWVKQEQQQTAQTDLADIGSRHRETNGVSCETKNVSQTKQPRLGKPSEIAKRLGIKVNTLKSAINREDIAPYPRSNQEIDIVRYVVEIQQTQWYISLKARQAGHTGAKTERWDPNNFQDLSDRPDEHGSGTYIIQ